MKPQQPGSYQRLGCGGTQSTISTMPMIPTRGSSSPSGAPKRRSISSALTSSARCVNGLLKLNDPSPKREQQDAARAVQLLDALWANELEVTSAR
jgi:hypothetical protein